MPNKIWKKFALALLIVAFAPILYFGYQDLNAARSSVADKALREIFLNVVTRAKEIERAFMNASADTLYLRSGFGVEALLDVLQDAPEEEARWRVPVEKEFIRFLALKPGYSSVGLLDDYGDEIVVVTRSGNSIYAIDDIHKRNHLTSLYYEAAAGLDANEVAAIPMRTALHPSMDLRRTTLIRYATKVYGPAGRPRGVLYADLNGSELFHSLTAASFERRRVASLLTNDGSYIFNPFVTPDADLSTHPPPESVRFEFPKKVTQQILSGRPGVIMDNQDYLFAYSAVYPQRGDHSRFFVVFDRYPRALFAPKLAAIKKKYFLVALMMTPLIVALAVIVSRALTRQIDKLREGVERFRGQDLSHRVDIRSHDEIRALADAYNMMADSLQEYSQALEKKVEERTRRIKQVERKLMQAEKMAAIGFLSAGVAHEINNPISVIITRLDLMKKAIEKGDIETTRNDLEVLRSHAARIGQIAGGLLTFSREKSRRCEAVDLNVVAERVLSLMDYSIAKKGVRLSRRLEPDLPLVWANAAGMEQVIYNLVYNAYQATGGGESVTVTTRPAGERSVELVVRDTGAGIPADVIGHVFEPFFTTKETGHGTGLGLSISFGLVQDFGGVISVESEPGRGAVFTVRLDTARKRLNERRVELVNADA